MHYIGMDCHITTLDFAVVNEAGRLVKANSVATSVNGFMEFVKTVPPPRAIYMEEGTLECVIGYKKRLSPVPVRRESLYFTAGRRSVIKIWAFLGGR
jgi:hypothetical protein